MAIRSIKKRKLNQNRLWFALIILSFILSLIGLLIGLRLLCGTKATEEQFRSIFGAVLQALIISAAIGLSKKEQKHGESDSNSSCLEIVKRVVRWLLVVNVILVVLYILTDRDALCAMIYPPTPTQTPPPIVTPTPMPSETTDPFAVTLQISTLTSINSEHIYPSMKCGERGNPTTEVTLEEFRTTEIPGRARDKDDGNWILIEISTPGNYFDGQGADLGGVEVCVLRIQAASSIIDPHQGNINDLLQRLS